MFRLFGVGLEGGLNLGVDRLERVGEGWAWVGVGEVQGGVGRRGAACVRVGSVPGRKVLGFGGYGGDNRFVLVDLECPANSRVIDKGYDQKVTKKHFLRDCNAC